MLSRLRHSSLQTILSLIACHDGYFGLHNSLPNTPIVFSMDHQSGSHLSRESHSPGIDNSFFRSWALRARNSEHSSTGDVSPGTRTQASSPVSPKTVNRPLRRGRRNFKSRASDSYIYQVNSIPSQQIVTALPDTLFPGSTSQKRGWTRITASVDSRASKSSSDASSIAQRALRLMKRPSLARQSATVSERRPTRPARGGFAWKRQVSGHFLEIRIGKRPDTDISPPDTQVRDTPHAPCSAPVTGRHIASEKTKAANASEARIPLRPPTIKSTDSSPPEEKSKKSLLNRTKRILGIKSTNTLPAQQKSTRSPPQSQTGNTLDRASSVLRDFADRHKLTPPSGSTSQSNLSATSIGGKFKYHHRTFVRPGHRRPNTGHSSSSSVRRVMFGNPPVSTPDTDTMYTGSDAQQYFRVELTDAGAPTYLPSEARRIGTPPLPGANAKLRGFFFDYNAPHPASEGAWPNGPMNTAPLPHRQPGLDTPSRNPTTPRSSGARLQREDVDVTWFRNKVAINEAEEERDKFELNVPEHLPSSPLCPRHPKHKSGGRSVCVYHGRNKTGTDDVGDEGMGWR